jgi:CheY-like chemotaxis protein
VDVASEPGDGATFTLSLPATDEEVFSAEDTQGEIMLGRGTVLVVDDDEAVLEACASILSYLEYTPLRADTGTRAVELFEEHSGAVDLVILDMILPDISGGDVFDAIRSIDPHIKVLLASGYSLNGAAQDILERGCDDFIQKPFTIEQLSQKINTVLSEAP